MPPTMSREGTCVRYTSCAQTIRDLVQWQKNFGVPPTIGRTHTDSHTTQRDLVQWRKNSTSIDTYLQSPPTTSTHLYYNNIGLKALAFS